MNKPEDIINQEVSDNPLFNDLTLICYTHPSHSNGVCSIMDYEYSLDEIKILKEWLENVIKYNSINMDNINNINSSNSN